MTRWRGFNPGYVAARMVQAVKDGDLQTRGQWVTFADTVMSFPLSVRDWVIAEVRPVIGEDSLQYVLSFASTPRNEFIKVEEVEA